MAAGVPFMSVEERFEAADDAFLQLLKSCRDAKLLRAFAEKWLKDSRPWARWQLDAYLGDWSQWNSDHRPMWKRLLKLCDEAGDHPRMARFMVWTDRDQPLHSLGFGRYTRDYLRRRTWRHLRRLGFRELDAFRSAALVALRRYLDQDIGDGKSLLRRWGLVHILFHESPHLIARQSGWRIGPDRALSILKPAPAFPKAWEGASADLLDLVAVAPARTVRWWAMEMLKASPAMLTSAPAEAVARMLLHADEEVRTFAASLLATCSGLSALPIATWLRLLEVQDTTVLEAVCTAMQKSVSAAVLSPSQRIELASAPSPSVARLGIRFLREAPVADRAALLALADVRAAGVGGDAVALLREQLGDEALQPCLDSARKEVRSAALAWLDDSPLRDDPATWARLLESPHDDVRLPLVRMLEDRLAGRALPSALRGEDLLAAWAAVLLGIHRGSREKLASLRHLVRHVEADDSRAGAALPLLAIALRSVRAPERRAGLAAVVRIRASRPDLADPIARAFPELRLAGVR